MPLDYEMRRRRRRRPGAPAGGQAKRLRADELPALDRPLRFAVQRGRHPPILADTVPDLQALDRRTGSQAIVAPEGPEGLPARRAAPAGGGDHPPTAPMCTLRVGRRLEWVRRPRDPPLGDVAV